MKAEVGVAATFVANLMTGNSNGESVDDKRVEIFKENLESSLMALYKHHWHPAEPTKGSGYRCLRTNHQADPIIQRAANRASLASELHRLPAELTIWVDPQEVSYRIGEDGSVCNLLKASTPSTSVSPDAESWYPVPRLPPSPSVSPPRQASPSYTPPRQTSPSYSYGPANSEVRRSPPARRLSQPDSLPWSQSPSLSWLNATVSNSGSSGKTSYNHEYTRHSSYRQAYPSPPESPPTIVSSHRQFMARSPSPPHKRNRMARFVVTPVS